MNSELLFFVNEALFAFLPQGLEYIWTGPAHRDDGCGLRPVSIELACIHEYRWCGVELAGGVLTKWTSPYLRVNHNPWYRIERPVHILVH
jgi:hypothetical protein